MLSRDNSIHTNAHAQNYIPLEGDIDPYSLSNRKLRLRTSGEVRLDGRTAESRERTWASGLPATNLPLLPRLFQFPVTLGILLAPS